MTSSGMGEEKVPTAKSRAEVRRENFIVRAAARAGGDAGLLGTCRQVLNQALAMLSLGLLLYTT